MVAAYFPHKIGETRLPLRKLICKSCNRLLGVALKIESFIADILQVSVGELIGAESGDEKYAALFMMIKQLPPSKLQSVVDFTKFISNYK